MKFTLPRETFTTLLAGVTGGVARRATLPILSCVHLQAQAGQVRCSATDLDLFVSSTAAATTEAGTADLCLPAAKLQDIVRSIAGDTLTFETDDAKQVAVISGGTSRFKLLGLPGTEFPPTPALEPTASFSLPQKALRAVLATTSHAISTDEARLVLCGLKLELEGKTLTAVATDGRRLAHHALELAEQIPSATGVILPGHTVPKLQKLLGEDGLVQVALCKTHARFTCGAHLLLTKLVDLEYPNWRQVVPERKPATELDRSVLLSSVRRTQIVAENGLLDFAGQALTVRSIASGKNGANGEFVETLLVPAVRDVKVKFNLTYLADPLEALDTNNVHLQVTDAISPAILTSPALPAWFSVIMPLRDAEVKPEEAKPETKPETANK